MVNLKFEKKNSLKLETQHFKNPRPIFMRTIGKKLQEKFENFRL